MPVYMAPKKDDQQWLRMIVQIAQQIGAQRHQKKMAEQERNDPYRQAMTEYYQTLLDDKRQGRAAKDAMKEGMTLKVPDGSTDLPSFSSQYSPPISRPDAFSQWESGEPGDPGTYYDAPVDLSKPDTYKGLEGGYTPTPSESSWVGDKRKEIPDEYARGLIEMERFGELERYLNGGVAGGASSSSSSGGKGKGINPEEIWAKFKTLPEDSQQRIISSMGTDVFASEESIRANAGNLDKLITKEVENNFDRTLQGEKDEEKLVGLRSRAENYLADSPLFRGITERERNRLIDGVSRQYIKEERAGSIKSGADFKDYLAEQGWFDSTIPGMESDGSGGYYYEFFSPAKGPEGKARDEQYEKLSAAIQRFHRGGAGLMDEPLRDGKGNLTPAGEAEARRLFSSAKQFFSQWGHTVNPSLKESSFGDFEAEGMKMLGFTPEMTAAISAGLRDGTIPKDSEFNMRQTLHDMWKGLTADDDPDAPFEDPKEVTPEGTQIPASTGISNAQITRAMFNEEAGSPLYFENEGRTNIPGMRTVRNNPVIQDYFEEILNEASVDGISTSDGRLNLQFTDEHANAWRSWHDQSIPGDKSSVWSNWRSWPRALKGDFGVLLTNKKRIIAEETELIMKEAVKRATDRYNDSRYRGQSGFMKFDDVYTTHSGKELQETAPGTGIYKAKGDDLLYRLENGVPVPTQQLPEIRMPTEYPTHFDIRSRPKNILQQMVENKAPSTMAKGGVTRAPGTDEVLRSIVDSRGGITHPYREQAEVTVNALDPRHEEKINGYTSETAWDSKGNPIHFPKQVAQWLPIVERAAQKYNLPVDALMSQIKQESSGNPNAVSDAGAIGLMQIMPTTAPELGYKEEDLRDPEKNIDAGAKYMRRLLDMFKDPRDAVAAYNWGMGNMKKLNKMMDIQEKLDGGRVVGEKDIEYYKKNKRWFEIYKDKNPETRGYLDAVATPYLVGMRSRRS